MTTQGEVEAAVADSITCFVRDYMGRHPKEVRTHLIRDLLVVRLRGILSAVEQQLVKELPPAKGRDLLKRVRTQMVETARPVMEAVVEEATNAKVVSLHHDVSTATGEEVILFALAGSPWHT